MDKAAICFWHYNCRYKQPTHRWHHWPSGKRDQKTYLQHQISSYVLVPPNGMVSSYHNIYPRGSLVRNSIFMRACVFDTGGS